MRPITSISRVVHRAYRHVRQTDATSEVPSRSLVKELPELRIELRRDKVASIKAKANLQLCSFGHPQTRTVGG